MQLEHSSWPEVEAYLRRSKGILVPVGSTEQHGPTCLIGTDTLCAEAIARHVGERLAAMVGPAQPIGIAEHHLGFSGSLTLSRDTFMAVLTDYARALVHHGFRHLYVVNGHGGNISALREWSKGIDGHANESGAALRCRFVNWWMGRRTSELRRRLYGDREGVHATPSEIAVTQHLLPGSIKRAEIPGPIPTAQSFSGAADYRAKFPDGRVGSDPALATPEDGAQILAASIEDVIEDYTTFLAS